MKPEVLDKLIWILILGGLIVAALGLFVARQDPTDNNVFGGSLMSFGGIAAAVGVVLIYVRSRMEK